MSLRSCFALLLSITFSSLSAFAQVQGPGETTNAERHDESEELRHIHPLTPGAGHRQIPLYRLPQSLSPRAPDPVVQTQAGTTVATGSGLNFDGVGQGFSGPNGGFTPDAAPPDTNGSVGSTQFVQWVNEEFAVFDKATGAVLYGPAAGNTLWSGFGGKCESNNDGDIIVLYDKAANRWVMTQFAVGGGGGYYQCVAISQTSDAMGAWYRYAFAYDKFPDYPKVGVWPDAYYVTFNMFQGNSFAGPRVCAWDRTRMLQGLSATQVCFQLAKTVGSMLPADLDGTTPPPAGAPNYVLTKSSNALRLYKFHVNFVTPSNSTFTGPTTLSVAAFSDACGGGACIPQPGTQQLLDSLGDRLMYRLAYRNFGDHEALVANHSIATANSIGVRWYELRNPGGTPVVYQQGTFAPDSDYRWMGSIAMDRVGNIALGYSISSSSRFPSIRYTVRAPGDPLGQMGAENQIVGGGGSQLQGLNRWGDYSSMSVDPVDDCTFWYTNEYLKANGTFNWSTRIASFKMDSCGPATTIAVNVQTNPVGLQISVDGTTYTAPQGFNWTPGSNHTIATSTPQGGGGTRYIYASWSDAGAISHSVAPTVGTTYTANFATQYLLTTGVSPSGSGTVTPNPSSADGYFNSGTSVQLSAAANSGFTFSNWSGGASGSTNPTSVVMSAPKTVTANFTSTGGGSSGLRFVPVTPCRVVDTRNPDGTFGGPIISGGTFRSFPVPASPCGIPTTAQAYSINITVVPPGTLGSLTIWPTGQTQPPVSNLSSDGRIKAVATIVGPGTSGAVSVFVSDSSHVILDINGYFAPPADSPSGLLFYTVTPCRVMDSRLANGPLGGPIFNGGTNRTVPVLSSSCGLPPGAAAYSLNITVVPSGGLGYLTIWPTGVAQPLVSTLNSQLGGVVSNAAIIPAGTDGSVDVFVSNQTHVIIDVNGYFAPPAAGGLLFNPTAACRLVDTRNAPAPFGGPALLGARDFNVPAGPCPVSATSRAYSVNAMVLPQGALGYLTLWPTGQAQPFVSTLNSPDGSVVSNAALVATDTGAISAYATNTTDLLLDVNGYFAP